MHRILMLCVASIVFANPIAEAKDRPSINIGDGPGIVYRLPKANVKLSADLILRRCDPDGAISADSTIALAATPSADAAREFRLSAIGLLSGVQKRDLTIALNENLTIKSLNSVSEDRSGAVVLGVFKAAAQIAGAFFGFGAPLVAHDPAPQFKCNKETQDALIAVRKLEAAITAQRVALTNLQLTPAEVKAAERRITQFAAQLAALEQGPLKLTLATTLDVDKGDNQEATMQWTMGDLRKWFARSPTDPKCAPYSNAVPDGLAQSGNYCLTPAKLFALTYMFKGTKPIAPSTKVEAPCEYKVDDAARRGCNGYIIIVAPTTAVVTVKAVGDEFGGVAPGQLLGSTRTPMPQWGVTSLAPVAVKTAQSRTLELAFDGFGQVTQFKWTSAATAESAVGTVGSLAETALPVIKAVKGDSDTEKMKQQIEELELKHKLENLQACEAIRNAGGQCSTVADE